MNRLVFYFNAGCLALWVAMLPVTLLTGLKSSVPYVAAISVWALIAAHLVGTIAAKVGLTQERQEAQDKAHAVAAEAHREEIAMQHQTLLQENTELTRAIDGLTREVRSHVVKPKPKRKPKGTP